MILEINPKKLNELMNGDKKPYVIDVRRDDERALCQIKGSVHIPMDQIAARQHELPELDTPVVTYCHHGKRSLQVADFLIKQGFTNVMSLQGGVDEWAVQMDSAMKRY